MFGRIHHRRTSGFDAGDALKWPNDAPRAWARGVIVASTEESSRAAKSHQVSFPELPHQFSATASLISVS
jgi:hypothetical protein